MFNSARLKLTAWYVLIIMVISLSFSVVIYKVLTYEVDRLLAEQNIRLEQHFNNPDMFPLGMRGGRMLLPLIDPTLVEELKQRLITNLGIINLLIFVGAGGLAFLLAGKTLHPIKVMVEEQKRFIADASHELRTPLTALKTTLEVNLRDHQLTLKEARQTLADNLADVNRLQVLSNNLLRLAQLDERRSARQAEKAELSSAMAEALRIIKPLAKQKHIATKSHVAAMTVRVPERDLTELLVILLDNAIKYSPNKTTVEVTATQHGSQAEIKVSDQGYGIAAADLPHIFDRFYRVDTSRSGEGSTGHGLGLSIANKTVQQYHGTITVKSRPKQGTTFTVRLPLA